MHDRSRCLAVVVLASALAAVAGEGVIGAWVSPGAPYGIWKKTHGQHFPVEVMVKGLVDVGINEVIFFDQGSRGGPFAHRTAVTHAVTEPRMDDRDFLEEFLQATEPHGIGVWLAWTPPDGAYPGTDIRGLNDPRLVQFYVAMTEEIGRQYGRHRNLRGIHWHEVDCAEAVDEHEDDLAEFSAFCQARFGEAYSGDRMPRMDAADRWFRRYVLYRQAIVSDLVAATGKAAAPFNLKMSFCYYAPESFRGESWRWGYDILALEELCDAQWFSGYSEEAGKPYQTIRGAWIDLGLSYRGVNLPRNYAYGFHGGSLWFFEHRSPVFLDEVRAYYDGVKGWKEKYGDFYVGYLGHSERAVELFLGREKVARWLGAMGRWQGGDSPARVAVAVNPTPFMMQHPQAPDTEYTKKVRSLMVALSGRVDVDGLVLGSRFALSPENLRRYRLVVIPQDMGLGLSEAMAASLRAYLAQGGQVLLLATALAQSRADLTEVRDLTAELFGVEIVGPRLPGYVRPEGALVPAGLGKTWAAGQVEVRRGDAEVVLSDSLTGAPLVLRRGGAWFATMGFAPEAGAVMASCVEAIAAPPLRLAESQGLRMLESVRKDGAVAVSLWGTGTARLVADAAGLGLGAGPLQARDLVTGAVLAETDAAGLRQGVPVAITQRDQPMIVALGPSAALSGIAGLYPSGEVFRGLGEVMAVENPEVPTVVPDRPGLKVGVYHAGMGAAALLEALSRHDDLNVFPLSRLDREALGKCQVVLVPQPASRVFFNRSRDLLREWVDGGGRILFFHDAVGFKTLTAVFPEIGEGALAPKTHEAKVVKDHPITAGLAVGQTVRHAYADHIGMRVGPQGEAILTDAEGLAALVAGRFGKGRVVLQGMIAGYASVAPGDYKGREAAPEGDELRLLLQAVRWLGGPEE